MSDGKLPPGWKVIDLGELLTKESLKTLDAMLQQQAAGIPPAAGSWAKEILERVTNPEKVSLLSKGVDARYLAYLIEYKLFLKGS